ncbi:hypothetical protein [Natrarchaeobius oligotrophus]|uniref:Uncharacterized protein n=1 Tax=Natrarchaeobius chitinivorans TaxID=1679083 RepID=A0A3N6MGI5_NATCH|nr:hypothetical protein [Natrarchaeobius chitinivorans]RQH03099.1 hypothetical protein EA472_00410 [Natrarchaeobius chitinivorans]
MTDHYEYDDRSASPFEESESTDEFDASLSPETVTEKLADGTVALAVGGALILSAIRSLVRGRWRAIPTAIAGGALIEYGRRRRRSSRSSAQRSDRHESANAEGAPRTEFTEATEESEPRSKPGMEDDDAQDPRRNTDDDAVSIDVSETATADEASEATGPDPEQAQPAQTDAIEPEEEPAEDASHLRVEPDDAEPSDRAGDGDGAEGPDADEEGAEDAGADAGDDAKASDDSESERD